MEAIKNGLAGEVIIISQPFSTKRYVMNISSFSAHFSVLIT